MKYELKYEVWNDITGICLAAFRYRDEAHKYAADVRKTGVHGIKVREEPS